MRKTHLCIFHLCSVILVSSIVSAGDGESYRRKPYLIVTCGAMLNVLGLKSRWQYADETNEAMSDLSLLQDRLKVKEASLPIRNVFATDKSLVADKVAVSQRISMLRNQWQSSTLRHSEDSVLYGMRIVGTDQILDFYKSVKFLESTLSSYSYKFSQRNSARRVLYVAGPSLLSLHAESGFSQMYLPLIILGGAASYIDWFFVHLKTTDTLKKKNDWLERVVQKEGERPFRWAYIGRSASISKDFAYALWDNLATVLQELPKELSRQIGFLGLKQPTVHVDQFLYYDVDSRAQTPILTIICSLDFRDTKVRTKESRYHLFPLLKPSQP